MADLTFDGTAHTVALTDRTGKVIGTWHANNRTAYDAKLRFIPNGTYRVQDSRTPNLHGTHPSVNGPYGTQGIVRFGVPGHDGVGIHAGRQTLPDRTSQHGSGPDHVTYGCVRTTEEAMRAIANTMRGDPLTTIRVINNHNQMVTPRRQ
jgi:hypothetical protein